ncbi:MAG: tetratricopeptide repeat protein [bacterium]
MKQQSVYRLKQTKKRRDMLTGVDNMKVGGRVLKANHDFELSQLRDEPLKITPAPVFTNILAGRDKELKQLDGYFRQASKGSGCFVVVSGEAGIGKTALLRHFCHMVNESKEAHVVSIDFAQFGAYEPYAPFLKLIAMLKGPAEKKGGQLHEQRNWPRPGFDKGAEMETESLYSLQSNQSLIQQKLVAKISAAAQKTPLVISLNNLHYASATTWKFVHYLTETISEQRILLLTSLRRGCFKPSKEQPAYSDVLQRMNREGLVEQIELQPLDDTQINEFLHQVFIRKDFSGRFTGILSNITAGIPGELTNCLDKLVQASIIFQENGVWFDREDLTKESIMRFLNDEGQIRAVKNQVDSLAPNLKIIMRYMALMKAAVNHNLLAVIVKRSRLEVLRDMMSLKDCSMLTQTDDDCYEIKSAAIRSAVLEGLNPEEQVAMHAMIAAAIEIDSRIDTTDRVYGLAYHFSCTDDHHLAFKYLRQAGELAAKNFAFPEALDFFVRALNLYPHIAEAEHGYEVVQVLIWIAWLNRVLGKWPESIAKYSEALDLCDAEQTRLRNQILLQLGLSYFRTNDWQKARSCLEACLGKKEDMNRFDQAMASYGIGNIFFELGNYETACEHFEKALELAENLQAEKLLANIFNSLGAIENIRGQRMRAIAFYSKSIPIFKRLSDHLGLARVYHNIGMTHADDKNWQTANEFYGKSLRLSDVMGLSPLKSITFLNRALALTHLQRYNEAREYNFKACRLLERLKDELGMAEYHKIQGIIERNEGNWRDATDHLQRALRKFDALKNKLGRAECQQELGRLAIDLHNKEDAVAWFTAACTSYRDLVLDNKVGEIRKQLQRLESEAIKATESVNKYEPV